MRSALKLCDLALFSETTSSGVKTYIDNKIAYVSDRSDIEHVVIAPGKEDRVLWRGRSKVIVVRGVSSFYPGISVGINFGRIARLVERESPDIIELNCQYTLPWAAFLATRRSRAPIVGIYHTDLPALARHRVRRAGDLIASAAERLTAFYEGVIYRHCTRTVILNETMVKRVERLGVRRISCLPCGVDVRTFNSARRDPTFRDRLGIGAQAAVLLYAGRLSPEKELDVLLEAHGQLPPGKFVLLIAGDGPDAKAIARHATGHPGVKYLGHVESRSELAELYASSDIFINPSRYETFGMATLEALACGLPVVGISESGTATLVTPKTGILVRPGNAADLADAIATIATWRLDDLRSTCQAVAHENFAWNNVFAQYFEMYHELVEANRPAESVA